jgi:hypothetical protein
LAPISPLQIVSSAIATCGMATVVTTAASNTAILRFMVPSLMSEPWTPG